MDNSLKAIAQRCLDGAETNTMTFPDIVKTLIQAGFESYTINFQRESATYYLPDQQDSIELSLPKSTTPVAPIFDPIAIQNAVREAQSQTHDYTYTGFCTKIKQAGCACYIVSFLGQRVLYIGRTAETHVELFPQ